MLTELKSRYDGKCAKCGRELKVGWDVLYDREARKVFCTKCGKESNNTQNATGLVKTIGYAGLCSNCGEMVNSEDESYYSEANKEFLCATCGTISSSPKAEMQLISAKLEKKFDEIAGQNRLISELLGSLDAQIRDIMHNVSLLCAEPKEKKDKATTIKS